MPTLETPAEIFITEISLSAIYLLTFLCSLLPYSIDYNYCSAFIFAYNIALFISSVNTWESSVFVFFLFSSRTITTVRRVHGFRYMLQFLPLAWDGVIYFGTLKKHFRKASRSATLRCWFNERKIALLLCNAYRIVTYFVYFQHQLIVLCSVYASPSLHKHMHASSARCADKTKWKSSFRRINA